MKKSWLHRNDPVGKNYFAVNQDSMMVLMISQALENHLIQTKDVSKDSVFTAGRAMKWLTVDVDIILTQILSAWVVYLAEMKNNTGQLFQMLTMMKMAKSHENANSLTLSMFYKECSMRNKYILKGKSTKFYQKRALTSTFVAANLDKRPL